MFRPAGSFILMSALSVAACAPAFAQSTAREPLKLGVIGPFTGASSDFGVPMADGIRLAVDEINAVGGYLGRPLQIVLKDDKADPDTGVKMAQELIAEGVVATIGFCNTGVAMKALDIFQNAKKPLLVPCATGSGITAKFPAESSYVFRSSARDAIQAPFVVDDLVKRDLTRVAIFADTTGYGEAGLKDAVAALAAKNLKPVHVARFPLGVKDLKDEMRTAQAAGANVVFSYTVGPENAVIANDKRAVGFKVPQVGPWPLSFPFFLKGAGDAADGATMVQTFIAEPSNERRAAFLSAWKKKYDKPIAVPMAAAQGYDAAYLLTYALLGIRDGDLSGAKLKQALENIARVYYGVVATYEQPFSAKDHDALTPNMLVMGKVKSGAVTFAYAEDAKRNLTVQRKTK